MGLTEGTDRPYPSSSIGTSSTSNTAGSIAGSKILCIIHNCVTRLMATS